MDLQRHMLRPYAIHQEVEMGAEYLQFYPRPRQQQEQVPPPPSGPGFSRSRLCHPPRLGTFLLSM